ncbi:lauroyl acyltransferase [Acetobacter okinawensis]|uniref:lysophospholipid acyltransferase family protein n=1 Tax=Acetobacter okinawensis TaxID=1076594 RepID=UPI001BAA6BB6|nr:lauroyl acyltransferase [Acetobacter okinawensis]MBS0964769.1 lauroyl acyltransferase [Acetobacter okinawensis]MBS0987077.1 lauroyl acyltransferase [Acetobacter okinawensis]
MKKRFVAIRYRLEALLAVSLVRVLERLRPDQSSTLLGSFCRFVGPYLPSSRIVLRNLELAMPELDAAARARIVRGVWENLGRTLGELPHLAALEENTPAGPGFEVQGAEYLAQQAARGGPVLFVSGHIGNWEMLPPAVARHGTPFASFYRAAGNPLVDNLLRSLRNRAMGSNVVPLFAKGAKGARGALAYVSGGGRLGMLVDQKMNDGIEATFFGRPTMTAPALAAMALRYRCPVIPGYVERLGPARLRIVVEPPLELPDTGDKKQDLQLLVQMVNDRLESWIRQNPSAWLWLHRRWAKELYRAQK